MYWNVSHLPITEIWEGGDIHYLQRSSCMLNTITAAGKRRLSRSQGLSRNPLHSRRVLKQVLRNTARSPSRPQPHGPPSYGHSAAERREGASRRCIWEWVCRSLTGVKPGVGPGQSLIAYQRLCSTPSLWCKPAGTLCLGAWLWDGEVASGSAVAAPRAVHAGCLQLLGRRISNRSSSEEKGSEVCASGGTPTLLRSYLVRKPLLRDLCVLSALFLLSLGLF